MVNKNPKTNGDGHRGGSFRKLDIFISYNKADSKWAEWIAWQLEEADHTVVIEAWDFLPGCNVLVEMNRAVSAADRMVVVLSESYLQEEHTYPEWLPINPADPKGGDKKLIPVRVAPCEVEGLLGQLVYIDLVRIVDEELARDEILSGILMTRRKPRRPPAFPGKPPFPGADC